MKMDQIKIGKFIAELRKKQNLTQKDLAEKLSITDRAISKWENGKALPDSSLMLPLCSILKIRVDELLSGEVIPMENYNENTEQKLLELVKQKEESDKRLLAVETMMGIIVIVMYVFLVMLASYADMDDSTRLLIILPSVLFVFAFAFVAIRIEQTAGYYECQKCHHKYVPTYSSVLWAMHIGRTRYMKCPECHEKSWQKKVISK